MGQVHPLAKADALDAASLPPAAVRSIDSVQCSLCGTPLNTRALRYHVVSPQTVDTTLTVCHTCHRAALGEGYRPAQ